MTLNRTCCHFDREDAKVVQSRNREIAKSRNREIAKSRKRESAKARNHMRREENKLFGL